MQGLGQEVSWMEGSKKLEIEMGYKNKNMWAN